MAKIKDTIEKEKEFKNTEPLDEFVFDEKNHVYTLRGKPMYGVTHVLGVIGGSKTGALMQWAVNEAIKTIEGQIRPGLTYSKESIDSLMKEAKFAHKKKKESAGDVGTAVHKAIEEWIKDKTYPMLDEQGMKMFMHFVDWATKNNVKFLESEKRMYTEKLWVAGTVDAIAEIDGKQYIVDIKTYSGIYDRTPFLQTAAYMIMAEERGYDCVGSIIVRLGKDGTFDTHVSMDPETDKLGFISALNLFKVLETFKK